MRGPAEPPPCGHPRPGTPGRGERGRAKHLSDGTLSSAPPSKTHLPFKVFAVRKHVISHFWCIKPGGRLSRSPASSLLACCFHTNLSMPNEPGCVFPMPRSELPRSNCRAGNENVTPLTMTDACPGRRNTSRAPARARRRADRLTQDRDAVRQSPRWRGAAVAAAARSSSGGASCALTSANE